ncbi:MAG TPA: sigma-70 family RNA polymerase sigma factor [Streptosporangiaceae bacterium]|nr:sigma-70 family RNA polymerase sigma factor [Streptosporangiaceae bacterium]
MAVLERARGGDGRAFGELTDPYLSELRLHCYRILGSVQDAEDVLQETLLAAWRGLGQYEERASVRTWLYRIATNRCLNALRTAERRPRTAPAGPDFLTVEPTRRGDPLWLEPYPDALLEGLPDAQEGPEAQYEAKEAVALAFVTAVQHLPPRQRAVLVLRDVLGFRAAEVADMLASSEASVNSALQRARETMGRRLPGPDRERAPLPRSARERDVAARFATAFSGDDIDGVVALLTEDAWFTMPPVTLEFQGPEAIAGFLRDIRGWRGMRRYRLVPLRANGQAAFGCYLQEGSVFSAHGMIVLTLEGDRISALTRFTDNGILKRFGLPLELAG